MLMLPSKAAIGFSAETETDHSPIGAPEVFFQVDSISCGFLGDMSHDANP